MSTAVAWPVLGSGRRNTMGRSDLESHWERVYRTRRPDQVSWYCPHLETSLQLIKQSMPNRSGRIIDVGGGDSTLVDDLLAKGYRDIHVLDFSATALAVARHRLGPRAGDVQWLCGGVTRYPLAPSSYDLWHDRAVFHFLTSREERAAYVRQAARAVRPGGHVIVAAFGPQGPTRCSGLKVARYSPEALHAELGAEFHLLSHSVEMHRTPAGVEQQFVYCLYALL
jgi:SAM-dependent methyltransferase